MLKGDQFRCQHLRCEFFRIIDGVAYCKARKQELPKYFGCTVFRVADAREEAGL